jgi:DNA-binding CsgD family transcriptional regulator
MVDVFQSSQQDSTANAHANLPALFQVEPLLRVPACVQNARSGREICETTGVLGERSTLRMPAGIRRGQVTIPVVAGFPGPRNVSCTTLRVGGEELLLIEFPLPELVIPTALTTAEGAVVRLLLDGHGPCEIAKLRGASVNTVRNQIRTVHKKLRVASTAELARICFAPLAPGDRTDD